MIKNNFSLIICILSCFLVVLKIYTGNNIFLIIFLIVISTAIIFDKIENKLVYLLFFVSWIYTLKFQFDQFSLYIIISALYVLICFFYSLIQKTKFQFSYILSYFLFVSFVISVSLIQGGSPIIVIGFILNFTVVFVAVLFVNERKLFGKYTIIYAFGLLTSSIVRLVSYEIPAMNQYFLDMSTSITLLVNGNLYNRFSGLDQDPNYYSIQILIALTCLLVNVYIHGEKKFINIFLIITLSLFGLLSISKMFLISYFLLILITILYLLKNNIKNAMKFISILLLGGVFITLLGFDYFYDSFAQRLYLEKGVLNTLSTERGTIWSLYSDEILMNFNILLFGAGYGTGFLNDILSHNMYLNIFYYFGLIGALIILLYISSLRKMFLMKIKHDKKFNLFSISSIPLLIILFANLALDSFVMDFFPIHLFLVLFSLIQYKNLQ